MKGIYQIKNKLNGHSYVGQSVNIKNRISYHKSKMYNENAKEYNYVLYKALRKYGKDNFDFIILEEVEDERKLTERETYWYNLLKPTYNMIKPGKSFKARSKPVYQIDVKTAKIINTYPSATDAALDNGLDISSIAKICRNKKGTVGGYYWTYVEDYIDGYVPKKPVQGGKKQVLQIDAKTLEPLLIYDSISEAGRMNNIHFISISAVCNGRAITAGGYIWTFIPKQ